MKYWNFCKGFIIAAVLVLGLLGLPAQYGLTQSNGDFTKESGHVVAPEFLSFFNTRGGVMIFGYPITEPFLERGIKVQYFQHARLEYHPANPDPYRIQLGLLGDELKYGRKRVDPPQIPNRQRHYFAETGHTVSYAFLDFFRKYGGIDIFGYPITEMYYEDGRIVQYFQRMKLEWHPDNRSAPVQIGKMGEVYLNAFRNLFPPEALRPVSAAPIPAQTVVVQPTLQLRATVSLRYSVMGKDNKQTVSVLVTDDKGAAIANAQVQIQFVSPSGANAGASPALLTDARGFVRTEVPLTGGQAGERIVVRAAVTSGGASTSAENVFLLWW